MTGCASIVSGGPGQVVIKSNPSDAKLRVYDVRKDEQIINATTPHTATLKRGAGYFKGAKYRVVVDKEGYQSQEVLIEPVLNGWYIGNLLFGGLIGLLIVDPLTGAMYVLRPKELNADLVKRAAWLQQEDGLMIRLERVTDLPAELQRELQPIAAHAAP
jgi:hypothetical protein